MKTVETHVLIVGAGPAGLTAATLLARSGVDALTLTKYGTANAPRAHITNQRAVEVFRDLGVEEEAQANALPHVLMGKQVYATTFAGRELSRMMTWGTGDDRIGDYRAASPSEMCNIAQNTLEPILLRRAQELGADIRQDHEVRSIKDMGDYVEAHVVPRDGSPEFKVKARYALGCDGSRTVVGTDGGFEFEGVMGLRDAVTVWIDADLSRYTAHRSGALFVTLTPGSRDTMGVWTCVKPWTEWSTILLRAEGDPHDLDEETIRESIRASIGDDSIEFSIRKVSSWQFNHMVASDYQRGRLFIAGDAAHRHPPANGLGSNTSIQDSYNLAWKLALVVKGHASEDLLRTYTVERQPVGRRIIDRAIQSVLEMVEWVNIFDFSPQTSWDEANEKIDAIFGPNGSPERQKIFDALKVQNGQFNAHGVELGQSYESDAVVGDGSSVKAPERDADQFHVPTTVPGNPVPHAWLTVGDKDTSTLDLCKYDQFTIIVGADGGKWMDAVESVASELGVRMEAVQVSLGLPVNDVYGDWIKRREVDDDGCVLVRPDRIVAWRSMAMSSDPKAALRDVMSKILGSGKTASSAGSLENKEPASVA
ncbi:FAD-dependent monooxygenase [Pyruvatibacter sp.]|uniref:FAD-dependent monooxygenase n=1 Tax=Pyruvatibacter sp. TaxID=1981328 RepID=UPI0032647C0F